MCVVLCCVHMGEHKIMVGGGVSIMGGVALYPGLLWCTMVWLYMLVWCSVMWFGVLWCAFKTLLWCTMVWHYMLVWCGVMWFGLVYCGVLSKHCFGAPWCGIICWHAIRITIPDICQERR